MTSLELRSPWFPSSLSLRLQTEQEHAACRASIADGLEHAIRAGELLQQAKVQCEYGAWLPWLRRRAESAARWKSDCAVSCLPPSNEHALTQLVANRFA